MKPATILRIHSIISSALDLAVRYDWADRNVAKNAGPPHPRKREPDPPSPDQAARLLNLVWSEDDEFGLYLWTAFTTGARRGEVSALRENRCDFTRCRSVWPVTTWSSRASTSRRRLRTERAASCPWTC
jgi:integrase